VRRHLYLITDHPNEDYIGKVEAREKAYTRTEKNVERPVDTLNIDTGERCTISVVGLGYHDFDDRDDYEESFKPVVDRKLREVDQQHLDKAGVEVDREVATDGGEPIDETHADAYYKWPYDHGTQYLGRMGTMAFALFDFDDSGLVFPLAMDQAEWERRREDFQEIDADELPEKAHNKIEAKFDRRKSISKLLPDGGQTAAENAESLSLHFSTGGPIELEVWDYENGRSHPHSHSIPGRFANINRPYEGPRTGRLPAGEDRRRGESRHAIYPHRRRRRADRRRGIRHARCSHRRPCATHGDPHGRRRCDCPGGRSMTDDLDLSKPLTLTDPLAAARSRTVAEDGTVTIDVGKEYAGKIVDVGVSRAGNGPRTDGGESLVHPKLDDDLPDRPEYDTDAEAAIDDALVDLFVAARDGGDEYHHELAANLLGSHRLGDAKTLVTDGGQTVAPGAEDTPPAPSKDITVRPGGNGDQFLVFDDADEYRHVELLNDADARELYEKLGEALDSDGEELVTDGGQPDPGRRRDLVKQVLDTGFEDPLWLHNFGGL